MRSRPSTIPVMLIALVEEIWKTTIPRRVRHIMRHLASIMVIVLYSFPLGCSTTHGEGEAVALRKTSIPIEFFSDIGTIAAFDFIVDEDGSIHLMWSMTSGDSIGPTTSALLYSKFSATSREWTVPTTVDQQQHEPIHIRRAGSELHVFSGPRVKHHVSLDNGATWVARDTLLNVWNTRFVGLDTAIATDSTLLVVLLSRAQRVKSKDRLTPRDVLFTLHQYRGSEKISEEALFTLPGATHQDSQPRLLVSDGVIQLLCSLTEHRPHTVTYDGQEYETSIFASSMYYFQGKTVAELRASQPDRPFLTLGPHHSDSLFGTWVIQDIELLHLDNQPLVMFLAKGLYSIAKQADGSWSQPLLLARASGEYSSRYETSSLSAIEKNGEFALAWIDSRNQRIDPSVKLEPIYRSEDPFWPNNDVYFLKVNGTHLQHQHPDSILSGNMSRLTPDLSYADETRMATSGNKVILLWSGRASVTKHFGDGSAPPSLFISELSLKGE